MNEQEIRGLVEQIVLHQDASERATSCDDFGEASFQDKEVTKLETQLQEMGYLLADKNEGETIQVYKCGTVPWKAKSLWMIFDTANWEWQQPESLEENG